MLEPQTRATLTEQLAPPPGFELSRAVGTTFTLDLTTALSVPLSFASRQVSMEKDTIGILDAVRRVSDRIDIFAQAGEISMGAPSDLVAFLEPIIHPVHMSHGLFHPKIWFLEYAAGDHRTYRFLCASRNLTDDRSWDTIVRLDGAVAVDGVHRDENDPLVELLTALPRLAITPLSPERLHAIHTFAERVRSVDWELPPGVRELAFHTVGLPGSTFPDLTGKRGLIISPFASVEGLRRLRAEIGTTTHLLSRAQTLDALPSAVLDDDLITYVLDDAAAGDDDDMGGAQVDRLSGLHAKAVIVDRRDGAHVFLGSANATDAAWHRNVEVMVELTGPEAKFGVDATLEALGDLKEEYITEGGALESEEEKAARRLETLMRRLASAQITVRVVPNTPHDLLVWGDPELQGPLDALTDAGASLRWHLLTRADLGAHVLPCDEASAAAVKNVPLTDITPFIVLVAEDALGNRRRTIVLAELLDDVASRKDAIVARQLTDRAAFLRLLTLMLELSGDFLGSGSGSGEFSFDTSASDSFDGSGLFEALIRALGVGHSGLADVRSIVDYIREHGDDSNLLPEGFEELWGHVWQAHHSLAGGRL